jgi:hypothetical protein
VPDQLIVITGAGASFDCTSPSPRNGDWQPPLVAELFAERSAFTPILEYYRDAQTLAPDLRVAVRTGSVGLETYLRDHVLRSDSAYDRRRYRAIPLYLQHLLYEVGRHYTTHPVNYDRLINGVLRVASEVIFLTLNYDTILDTRLEAHAPILSLSDYIRGDNQWSLIKLHGSVDWARQILGIDDRDAIDSDQYLSGFVSQLDDAPILSEAVELRRLPIELYRRDPPRLYYPAMSVPLGPDDELNCPEEHVAYVRNRLTAADGLNVLSIGYSGLDSGLLKLLSESGNRLRSLFVVNHDGASAIEAAQRLASALSSEASADMAYPGSFEGFAQSGGLDEYLLRL